MAISLLVFLAVSGVLLVVGVGIVLLIVAFAGRRRENRND